MKHSMRSWPWMVLGAFLVLGGWICWAAVEANAAPADLAYYQQAKINWRQFEGQIMAPSCDAAISNSMIRGDIACSYWPGAWRCRTHR